MKYVLVRSFLNARYSISYLKSEFEPFEASYISTIQCCMKRYRALNEQKKERKKERKKKRKRKKWSKEANLLVVVLFVSHSVRTVNN